MRLKPPAKDSLTWIPLYAGVALGEDGKPAEPARPAGAGITTDATLAGVEVAVAYRGPAEVDEYNFRRSAIQLAEAQRLADLRAGRAEANAPELWRASTPEHERAQVEDVNATLARLCPQVREGETVIDGDEASEFLRGLSFVERYRLLVLALSMQSISRRQLLFAAGVGGNGAARPGPSANE